MLPLTNNKCTRKRCHQMMKKDVKMNCTPSNHQMSTIQRERAHSQIAAAGIGSTIYVFLTSDCRLHGPKCHQHV